MRAIRKLTSSMLLTLLLLTTGTVVTGEAYALWYGPNWSFRQMISIDSTQVPGDLTNFPVLVRVTDANLRVSPSGNVGKANGGDILFTLADGITKLDHEIESYNSATGELITWVEVLFVSSTSDTVIYMYYGNAGAANQWNINGTWNSNYVGVWHLSEDPSGTPPQIKDSTSNNNHGTSNGGMTSGDQMAGQVDGSLDFDGSNDYVNASGVSWPSGGPVTVEFWNKMNTADVQSSSAFTVGNLNNPNRFQAHAPWGNSVIYWDYGTTGNGRVSTDYSSYLDKWTHVVLVSQGNGGTFKAIYLDGVLAASGGVSDGPDTSLSGLNIGMWFSVYHKGTIDEFRISDVVRSPDWIETSYNNQNNPSSFLSFGAPETFVPVPTMNKLGMIIFMLLTALGAAYYLKRKGTV